MEPLYGWSLKCSASPALHVSPRFIESSGYNLLKQESEGYPSTEGANSHERSGIHQEGTAYPK